MKLNITISALVAVFAVAVGQTTEAETNDVPGVSAQPITYFYTGKPFDSDLGNYTFNYRTYSAEAARWTSADPSGFPDGANNSRYAAIPTRSVDPWGLTAINSVNDGLNFWHRPNGYSDDTAQAGTTVIGDYKNSDGFTNLIERIQKDRIAPDLAGVSFRKFAGTIDSGGTRGPADLGYVDLVVGRSSISYADETNWIASAWTEYEPRQWIRSVTGTTLLHASLSDRYDFTTNSGDNWLMTLLEEKIPGWIAGSGTPFTIIGMFDYTFNTGVQQYE